MNGINSSNRSLQKLTIEKLPIEIILMILELLNIRDALNLCSLLHLSEEVAFQYCRFTAPDSELGSSFQLIFYDLLSPRNAKALYKNQMFQSFAKQIYRSDVAIYTHDLDVMKHCLNSDGLNHSFALSFASNRGFLDDVQYMIVTPQ